jgi:hypothetical protein
MVHFLQLVVQENAMDQTLCHYNNTLRIPNKINLEDQFHRVKDKIPTLVHHPVSLLVVQDEEPGEGEVHFLEDLGEAVTLKTDVEVLAEGSKTSQGNNLIGFVMGQLYNPETLRKD